MRKNSIRPDYLTRKLNKDEKIAMFMKVQTVLMGLSLNFRKRTVFDINRLRVEDLDKALVNYLIIISKLPKEGKLHEWYNRGSKQSKL